MNKRVLLVDDEPGIVTALSIRLKTHQYEVVTAENGAAGVAAATSSKPDAIVLDVRLPDFDGFEVCRRIKAQSDLSDIPIVFLSANMQDAARQQAWDAGAAAYLSKPYNAQEVLETLAQAIMGTLHPADPGEYAS